MASVAGVIWMSVKISMDGVQLVSPRMYRSRPSLGCSCVYAPSGIKLNDGLPLRQMENPILSPHLVTMRLSAPFVSNSFNTFSISTMSAVNFCGRCRVAEDGVKSLKAALLFFKELCNRREYKRHDFPLT